MKSFLKGRINNGLTDVDCLIRDISATGARLSLSGGITIPRVIDLHIPLKKQTMHAQVNWRRGDEMGVSFIEDREALVAPSAKDAPELTERVLKLEVQIAALRKMLAQLRRDVFPHEDLADSDHVRS